MSAFLLRPGRPDPPRPGARPKQPGFLAEIGRMAQRTRLVAGERCRWCTNRLMPRKRRDSAFLECSRCDAPPEVADVDDLPPHTD